MISTIIKGLISFVSTNIDDIFVLMLFFSQTNNIMKRHHIVIGQYLGIGALTIISIIGAFGAAIIPHEYVGLLGLVPIYLGIKAHTDYKKESNDNNTSEQKNSKFEKTIQIEENSIITFIKSFIKPSIFKVASVTFANGGDNIGIYIPLFASMSLFDVFITVIVFTLLTSLWCFIALKLAKHPFIQRGIEKNKHIFVPIIFIGLGIFILAESGAITFIYKGLFSI